MAEHFRGMIMFFLHEEIIRWLQVFKLISAYDFSQTISIAIAFEGHDFDPSHSYSVKNHHHHSYRITSQDWKHFVDSVKGGICISGRRCYEELGQAMPGSSYLAVPVVQLVAPVVPSGTQWYPVSLLVDGVDITGNRFQPVWSKVLRKGFHRWPFMEALLYVCMRLIVRMYLYV